MGSWSFFIFFLLIRKKENPVLVDHRIYLYTDFLRFRNPFTPTSSWFK